MTERPSAGAPSPSDWLPALVLLTSYGGSWQAYEDALYQHFLRDFITSQPTFPGRRFAIQRLPESKGKAFTFWHLVSEGETEDQREADLRRCERICWPRAMVDEYGQKRVRCWSSGRNRARRILIALEDFSYVVVLDDRRSHVMLLTAYPVEHSNRRRQLRQEWENFTK